MFRLVAFIISIVLLACFSLSARAQTTFVVLDMEAYYPVEGVTVYTDRKGVYTSDKRGRVRIDQPFGSLTLSKKGYVARTLYRREVRDTVRLLPADVSLNEVIVVAKRPQISPQMGQSIQQDAIAYGHKPTGMNFLSIFERKPYNRKAHRKAREAIKNY